MRRILILALLGAAACGGSGEGEGPVRRVTIPPGASFSAVTDSLAANDIIGSATVFKLYGRIAGAAGSVQAGTYEFREGAGFRKVLDDLKAGRIAADRLVVPEGYAIHQIAPSLAKMIDVPVDSILGYMLDTTTASRFGVPGPTLEGYIYPATYVVPAGGVPLDTIIGRMVREHMRRWTPEHQRRADSAGLSHREVVTLASIVEKEARISEEMPVIAAVYRNRLEINYPLQADPTVQYALGEHQERLLYAHIDSVADHPYNTYTRQGLPPGAIGAPSERAIEAVLDPADVDYLYFVARPDGSHVFNRHLVDHNEDKARLRQQRDSLAADTLAGDSLAADSVATDPPATDSRAPEDSTASPG